MRVDPKNLLSIGLHEGEFDGQRVWIVCTGPSLTAADYASLEGEHVWGVGHLLWWPEMPFLPEFYGLGELSTYADLWWDLESCEIHRFFCLNPKDWGTLANRHAVREAPLPETAKYHMMKHHLWRNPNMPLRTEVSAEIQDGFFFGDDGLIDQVAVCPGCSALHSAVQPAVWLGFKEICFLGMDLSPKGYVVDGARRDADAYRQPGTPRWYAVQAALQVARSWCEDRGIRLVNCSRETSDRVLERRTVEEVLHGQD